MTPQGVAAMTVGEVLRLPVVARGIPDVVAGEEGLTRVVRWVHSGEIPNMSEMLKGGELLLITGIGLGQSTAELRQYVDQLSDRGIAGLLVELGVRFTEIPDAMVKQANLRGLPLIALHRQMPFIEITELVHRELLGRQLEYLRRGDEIHSRYMNLLLHGAGASEVLDDLANLCGNPVYLHRVGLGSLYNAGGPVSAEEAATAWERYVRGIDERSIACRQPIPGVSEDSEWGELVILPVARPLDRLTVIAAERAVTLVALALTREHADEMLRARERGDFLASLLAGELDDDVLRSRASALGVSTTSLIPIVIRPSAEGTGLGDSMQWKRLQSEVLDTFTNRHIPFVSLSQENDREILLVIGARAADHRVRLADMVAATAHRASKDVLGRPKAVTVTVGAVQDTWRNVREGLLASLSAAVASPEAPADGWIDASKPSVASVLWQLRHSDELKRFSMTALGPVLEHDRKKPGSPLLATVEGLCAQGGRKTEAAKQLSIERQTLYSRLARIEQLLDVSFSDPRTVFTYTLAVMVHHATQPN